LTSDDLDLFSYVDSWCEYFFAKFYLNHSIMYGDTTLREIGVDGQQTDSQTPDLHEDGRFKKLATFVKVLRLRRYERISVQNRRFRSNGSRLARNFR